MGSAIYHILRILVLSECVIYDSRSVVFLVVFRSDGDKIFLHYFNWFCINFITSSSNDKFCL